MKFPYTEVGPGIFRPLLAVRVIGPAGSELIDGLLDTGADRTLLPRYWVGKLGIDLDALTSRVTLQSASGHDLSCKLFTLPLELARDLVRVRWLAEVAIAEEDIIDAHWGLKGVLEFFRAEFDGPNRSFTLTPGSNLPVAAP